MRENNKSFNLNSLDNEKLGEMLIKYGADINIVDISGETALSLAIVKGQIHFL